MTALRDSLMNGDKRNPRYLLDVALIYPVIVGILQLCYSIASWPPSTWRVNGIAMGLATVGLCVLFAKDKAITFSASLGFMCVMGLVGIPIRAKFHSATEVVIALCGAITAGILAVVLVIWRGKGPTPYQGGQPGVDRLVISLAITLALLFFLSPLRSLYVENLTR
jgi:hypothetical protein